MLIAVILALIFVPLLFIMGIKTGMEQSENKWLKVMKENTSDNQQTITKLQDKLKQKNEEITELKNTSKEQAKNIEKMSKDLKGQQADNLTLTSKVKKMKKDACVNEKGIIIDDEGKPHCPLTYKPPESANTYL